LGAQVCYITVLGQDESAKTALELLQTHGIHSLYIHFTEKSATLTKTRLCKDGQLLYRLDVGNKIRFDERTNNALLKDVEKAYTGCDAVFISDYGKGTITHQIIDLLQKLKEKDDKVLAVDSKNYEKYKSLSPTIIKP